MIPKILHHVWPGADPFRPELAFYRQEWVRRHPDWSLLFWRLGRPEDLPVADARVAKILADDRLTVTVKSDILRLHVLDRFGGVYVDTDMECLRPFDSLLGAEGGFFCGLETPSFACPSVMGATPRHPLVGGLLAAAIVRVFRLGPEANAKPNEVTGPHLLTSLLREYPEVTVHPVDTFYPLGGHPRGDDDTRGARPPGPGTYAIHHWHGMRPEGWTHKHTFGIPAAEVAVSDDQPRPRVVVCHSPHERCGIRQYGRQLDEAFTRWGAEVLTCTHDDVGGFEIQHGDILFVHYEALLIRHGFQDVLRRARRSGAKIIFCCHRYVHDQMDDYRELVDRFVAHRYPVNPPQTVQIPLGCPVYMPGDRAALRERFGYYAPNTPVLITLGFLAAWKKFPSTIRALLGTLPAGTVMQVRTPWPFVGDASGEEAAVREAIAAQSHIKVEFTTDFLPEEDLLDRVRASDLGFLYYDQDTASSSAAVRQFVAARTPVMCTDSSHTGDILGGVRRGTKNVGGFAQQVAALMREPEALAPMRVEMEAEYARLNMDEIARRYATEIFGWPARAMKVAP